MTESTQPIPPGHENLIPHLVCSPCSEAIEYYKKAFGAEEIHRIPAPDGRRIMHAAIRIGKSFVFLVDDFPELVAVTFHLMRDGDVDPDREGGGSDQPVSGEVTLQGPKQSQKDQRNDAERGQK